MFSRLYYAITWKTCRLYALNQKRWLALLLICLLTVVFVARQLHPLGPGLRGGVTIQGDSLAQVVPGKDAPVVLPPDSVTSTRPVPRAALHPEYRRLIKEYPFQPVRTDRGEFVNVILVRSPFRSSYQRKLYEKYKDEILFLGICSFEDYPVPPPNPYSGKFSVDEYVGLFPGFLHMFRNPGAIFPSHVKLLLLSQSDFSLPPQGGTMPKKYDFTFSGSDQDVYWDCVGWSSFAKNWTFVKEALEVMCGELGMTGVLVATKAKTGSRTCSIPKSCEGKITQTRFLSQDEFFNYVKQSRFLFVPQIHDASPRVTTQALALNVPLLMNYHIIGGWKYINEQTGEFFHDLSDLREAVNRMERNQNNYQPRKYVDENLGDVISGKRLKEFVEEHFRDRVRLPEGTRLLFPTGA